MAGLLRRIRRLVVDSASCRAAPSSADHRHSGRGLRGVRRIEINRALQAAGQFQEGGGGSGFWVASQASSSCHAGEAGCGRPTAITVLLGSCKRRLPATRPSAARSSSGEAFILELLGEAVVGDVKRVEGVRCVARMVRAGSSSTPPGKLPGRSSKSYGRQLWRTDSQHEDEPGRSVKEQRLQPAILEVRHPEQDHHEFQDEQRHQDCPAEQLPVRLVVGIAEGVARPPEDGHEQGESRPPKASVALTRLALPLTRACQ